MPIWESIIINAFIVVYFFWLKESIKQISKNNEPIFTFCRQQEKIKRPIPKATPLFVKNLLDPNQGQKVCCSERIFACITLCLHLLHGEKSSFLTIFTRDRGQLKTVDILTVA